MSFWGDDAMDVANVTLCLPLDVQAAHGHTASTLDQEEEEDDMMMVRSEELSCPISFQLLTDAVVAEDGHTYRQQAIEEWIDKCTTSTYNV
jgi:hypothetical protein